MSAGIRSRCFLGQFVGRSVAKGRAFTVIVLACQAPLVGNEVTSGVKPRFITGANVIPIHGGTFDGSLA